MASAGGGSCLPACLSADHALVSLLPFEFQGGGWNGAYYFIRPYSAFQTAAHTSSQPIVLQDQDQDDLTLPSSFLADTLESGFGESKL